MKAKFCAGCTIEGRVGGMRNEGGQMSDKILPNYVGRLDDVVEPEPG